GEPGAAVAGEPPRAPAGDHAGARHLVHRRPLSRRRADGEVRRVRRRALALRGDPRREPLDPPRRTRPAERAAAGLAALTIPAHGPRAATAMCLPGQVRWPAGRML